MRIILEIFLAIMAADFISGLVHWMEDTFWSEGTPIVGQWIVRPNSIHHRDGMAFVKNNWWRSSWDLLLLGLLVLVVAKMLGVLAWPVWLFVLIGVNANQIHKWAHMPKSGVPAPIRYLQRLHLLQSPAHHAVHHARDKNSHYCVVTNILNPVLDGGHFWRALEWILVPIFGSPRRDDINRRRRSNDSARRGWNRVKGWSLRALRFVAANRLRL
jgi:sterol desaturase/sphingolipid hydroxylase (fatty acid hydroxylase superfamily)